MPDVSFRHLQNGLRALGLTPQSRVIAHASLSAFGHVPGGAEAVVAALAGLCELVVMPAFTYQCLVRPPVGPPDNAMLYGDFLMENAEAEIFRADLPAHADMGVMAETLRRLPGAARSSHPVLSFTAVGQGAEAVMAAQTLAEPFGPIAVLEDLDAEVVLLGVSHSVNTSIHLAEQRAGRKQFVRWALTARGAVECPAWPGDSAGFDALTPHLAACVHSVQIGQANAQRFPLREVLRAAETLVRADPLALLCNFPHCDRCAAVRASVNTPLALR